MKTTALTLAFGALCTCATFAQAKPTKAALVDIEPISCDTDADDPVSTVDVVWNWNWETDGELSPPHTQFGGDADIHLMISATDNLSEPTVTLTNYLLTFAYSVSKFDQEKDQTNELVYSCDEPETLDGTMSATCSGSLTLSGLDQLANSTVENMFPSVETWDNIEVNSVTLDDVKIKAMDPSVGLKGMKYQKYPLVSLCTTDEG